VADLKGLGLTLQPSWADLPPEQQLIEAMVYEGLTPPSSVVMDGHIHRFRSKAGKRSEDGWYIAFKDARPAGHFGCWASGVDVKWQAEGGEKMTAAEEIEHAKRMAEMHALREEERVRRHAMAAEDVKLIWDDLDDAEPAHPYLERKGIQPHGAKVTKDGRLVVPLWDKNGDLASLQYIQGDGGKRYHPGGETGASFHVIGLPASTGVLYLAEGYATAATIHEVTERPCIVGYSASNLVPVAGILRELYPDTELVIVADNDKGGVGQRYAEQAVAKHGGRFVVPPVLGDANDYVQAGQDLAALLAPAPVGDWLIPADDFCAQPAPISWLVKGWLQTAALIMVHGPSGGGKTFVVLDWCLRMAGGLTDWMGAKVRPGPVVYLAGEGHHGLRGRVAAWKIRHQVDRLEMWLSRDGLDLNTAAGLKRVIDNIRGLPSRPSVIVVDTLHRFLSGDENSAQDAKTMLDACAVLMGEFRCSVLLVHHTGVSDEAQTRARGSSAWKGALDIEVSVVPAKDGGPISIVQRKSKDAELAQTVYARLQSVEIPGWLDEDGLQVTSAVLEPDEAPVAKPRETAGDRHRKTLGRAWFASGCELREGMPYVARSAFLQFLVNSMGVSDASAAVYLKPGSSPGKLIRDLLDSEIVRPCEHGWVVCDPGQGSALLLQGGTASDGTGGTTSEQ